MITEEYLFSNGWMVYNYSFYHIGDIVLHIKNKKLYLKNFLYGNKIWYELDGIDSIEKLNEGVEKLKAFALKKKV